MYTEIMMIGGAFWSATYILIIRQGFKDKTYGMPMAALCANISWEAIFAFLLPHDVPQLYVDYIWFSLDAVIVAQFFKYGKKEFPSLPRWQFYSVFVLGISTAFSIILATSYEFDDYNGVYAAFGQNLMMSALFVVMLMDRQSIRGQLFYIALFKMIGTGLSSLAFYLYRPMAQESILLQLIFVAIFVFDLVYTIALYKKHREFGISLKKI